MHNKNVRVIKKNELAQSEKFTKCNALERFTKMRIKKKKKKIQQLNVNTQLI